MEDKVFLRRAAKFARKLKSTHRGSVKRCKKRGCFEENREKLDKLIQASEVMGKQVKESRKITDKYEYTRSLYVFSTHLRSLDLIIRDFMIFNHAISDKRGRKLLSEISALEGYVIPHLLNEPHFPPSSYKSFFDKPEN